MASMEIELRMTVEGCRADDHTPALTSHNDDFLVRVDQ
jgi:hypothetical protein